MGYGLSCIQDCDVILVSLKEAGGHKCRGSVNGPLTLSGYSPNVLVPCCGWRFRTCRTRNVWGCKTKCSEERASCLLRNPAVVCRFRRARLGHMRPIPCCLLPRLRHLSSLSWRSRLLKRSVFPSGHGCFGAIEGCRHVFDLLPLRRFLGRGGA